MKPDRYWWYILNLDGGVERVSKGLREMTNAILREDMVTKAWLVDEDNELDPWKVVLGCIALGAKSNDVASLIIRWKIDNERALYIAPKLGVYLVQDAPDLWIATFSDTMATEEGRSTSAVYAMGGLAKAGKERANLQRMRDQYITRSVR